MAHGVFCADSPSALFESGQPGGRERCVLLLSAMIRSAGLDPFEAGDVWAKLSALRPPVTPPTGPARHEAVSAMRRLMNADAAQRPDTEPGSGPNASPRSRALAFASASSPLMGA